MKQDLNGVRTPEDVMRRLAENVKVTTDEVNGLTIEVSKKVGEDEIISKINQSPESITLDADKININGVISANGNFKVDKQGNLTCNDATMNNVGITGGFMKIQDQDGNNLTIGSFEGITFEGGPGAANQWATNSLYGAGYYGRGDNWPTAMYYDNYMLLGTSTGTYQITVEADGDTGEVKCKSLNANDIYYNNLHPSSLEEKKKDFEKLESGLDIVKDTDIYKYHFKDQKETDKKHIGFVIGDEFNYRKELTDIDNKGVDLYSMVSVLWRAVQEQQVEIEKLKKEVKNDKN